MKDTTESVRMMIFHRKDTGLEEVKTIILQRS
jgi:hypothetical protein